LALANSLLAAVDPRGASPFDRGARDQLPTRAEIIDSLTDIDRPEATAVLVALAAMTLDEVERRRLERAAATRNHVLPPWLGALAKARRTAPPRWATSCATATTSSSGCDCRRATSSPPSSRLPGNGPEVFRRRGRTDTAAGAICWAVCRANDTFDQSSGGLTQKKLGEHFGLKGGGGLSSRAATLLEAGRFPGGFELTLGSPALLVSRRRRGILAQRDLFSSELGAPAVDPAAGPTTVHQLRITIEGTTPPVWRRVLVPGTITLDGVHHTIQRAFGWDDDHLHEFEIGRRRYGTPTDDDWGAPVIDEHTARLDRIAPRRCRSPTGTTSATTGPTASRSKR
jgi:hypothetical protein